ncbi:hypothetical protein BGX31_004435, partial [Mortierella sp. GBA43]
MLDRLRRYAFWACGLQIDSILKRDGSPESRKAELDEVLDGDSFGKVLATLLLTGKLGPGSAYTRALKKGEPVKMPLSLEAYTTFSMTSGLPPIKQMPLNLEDVPGVDPTKITLTNASETVMVQVQTALRCHYRNAQFEVEKDDPSMSAVEHFYLRNSIEKKYKDFPQASYAPRFSFLSESALVDILWSNSTTQEALRVLLDLGPKAFKNDAEHTVLSHKGLLISRLFYNTESKERLSGYHNKLSLQEAESSTRYKLKGTVCTNGLTLNLLAYDTHHQRPRKTDPKAPNDLDLEGDLDLDMQLDDAFLDEAYGEEEADCDTQEVTTSDLCHINWKRGSDLLPNVEVTFDKKENCPPADKTIVVG